MWIAFVLLAILFILGLTNTIFKFPAKKIIPMFQFLLTKSIDKPATENKLRRKPHGQSKLKMVFGTFDKNKDGFITKQELRESFEKIGISMSETAIDEMVQKSDSNGDGLIEFDEFCDLYESIDGAEDDVAEDERDLKEAFDVFDGDKDGMISVEELRFMLRSLGMGEGGTVESCKQMINQVDVNGDGMVSFDEFKTMMRSGVGTTNEYQIHIYDFIALIWCLIAPSCFCLKSVIFATCKAADKKRRSVLL